LTVARTPAAPVSDRATGRQAALAVTAVALALRLIHLAWIHGHPFYTLAEQWADTDMHQFLAWARHLAAGDWLDRETFRPWFDWQAGIAPPGIWREWYGAHVYYQPPLYPYLLAIGIAVTGSLDVFRVAQAALGAVNCGLIATLAWRVAGPRAAWIAGGAAALYAPFILYDAELLRGTVVMTTHLLMLLALVRWHAGRRAADALLAGSAFGLSWLADPSILLFAPLAMAWMASAAPKREWIALRAPALFAAGAAAALIPLAARNAAVGAPLLSSTTRGPLAFVMGNAPDARPAGAYIPTSTGSILNASGYRMGATMRETLRRYDGHYGALLSKQWDKLTSLWGAYEVPDNPSFYYAARVSPVVGWGLRFLPVAALGLIGLGIALQQARRGMALAALVPLFVLATHGVFLLAHVNSRYRQPLAMAVIMLSGTAAAWAWENPRRRAAGVIAAAAVAALLLPKNPPDGYGYDRPAEYVMVARAFQQRGETGRAISEMKAAAEAARRETPFRRHLPSLLYELGTMQAAAGDRQGAEQSFKAVLAEDPAFEEATQALEDLHR
jgi:hypothetical protein